MKKIIAVTLVASIIIPGVVVNAQESKISSIKDAISVGNEIHVLYNDTIVNCDDVKPVNADGRVMMPFRVVLENMGATVDYNEDEKLVTATKGDTTINFTLMEDTISIDENGVKSTIKMDTPMIIVDDSTLVPIRFMSDALDMQVGWDESTETVLIFDRDEFFDKFENIAPNMFKLITMKQPAFNSNYTTFNFSSNTISVGGTSDGTFADNASKASVKFDVSYNDMEIKDLRLELIVKDGKLYIKTDAVEKLATTIDNASIKSAALAIKSDVWYTIDFNKVIDAISMSEETKTMLKTLSTASVSENADLLEMIKTALDTEGDVSLSKVISCISVFDMYEQIDKYISITEKENGGCAVHMNITTEDFVDMIESVMGDMMTDEKIKMIKDSFKYEISTNSDYDGNKRESDVKIDIGLKLEGQDFSIMMNMDQIEKKDDTVTMVVAPKNIQDVTDLLLGILK